MKPVPELSHQQAAQVLPWFVNGTLTGQEHAAVEAHVRDCLRCRSELEQLNRWQGEFSQMMHERPVPPAVASSRAAALIARAAAADGPAPVRESERTPLHAGRRRSVVDAIAAWVAVPSQWLTAAPRAAVLAISMLLVAGALTWSLLPRAPDTADFRTLTTPDSLPAGQYLRVVLHPQSDAGSMDRLLREFGLTIVAGPSEHGVYTLTLDIDDWPQAVATLEADPAVLFAETFVVAVGHDDER
jgi:hypothetical protein